MTAKKKESIRTEEPYEPMAVEEPTTDEKMDAITLRITVLETEIATLKGEVTKHNRYHFGKTT